MEPARHFYTLHGDRAHIQNPRKPERTLCGVVLQGPITLGKLPFWVRCTKCRRRMEEIRAAVAKEGSGSSAGGAGSQSAAEPHG